MKAKLLFLLIFISFITYGQKYIELYKEHLPAKILQWDAESKEMINSQIEGKILLNPSLMYSFIEYLSKRYDENILNEDENLLNYNRALTAEQYKARNRWIEKEVSETRKKYPYSKSNNYVVRFFNNNKSEEMHVQAKKVDSLYNNNLKAFFSLVYLTNKSALNYNAAENYSLQLENYLIGSIKEIADDVERYKIGEGGDKETLKEKIFSLWYAFDKFDAKATLPYNKDAVDYLIEIYEVSRNQPRTFEINLLTAFNLNNTIKIEEKYYLPVVPDQLTVSQDYHTMQYAAGLNIKLITKTTKTIFSNVTLEGSYQHNILKKSVSINKPYSGNMYGNILNMSYSLPENENEFLLKSVSSFVVKATTPLYFPFDFLSIDAGAMIVYNNLTYDWKGRYTFEIQSGSGEVLYQQKKTFANDIRKVSEYSILPVVDLNFTYLDPVTIQLSGNYKFAGLTFQVNLVPFFVDQLLGFYLN